VEPECQRTEGQPVGGRTKGGTGVKEEPGGANWLTDQSEVRGSVAQTEPGSRAEPIKEELKD